MSRRTRAWQLLVAGSLLLGCKPNERDPDQQAKCSTNTPCAKGYKCDFGDQKPSPTVFGECKYEECGLTAPCKKKHPKCLLDTETAMCDSENNDKYCECIGPNSQPVPEATPTTGASAEGKP